jgi:16S rRNA G966 N2-methylase RsmD
MEALLDDLQYKGLFLYQRPDLPRFSQDSVLLAAFAELTARDIAADIGAGTGALSLLCGARTGAKFTAIEKDAALCELLRKSAVTTMSSCPSWRRTGGRAAPARLRRVYRRAVQPPYYAAARKARTRRAHWRAAARTRSKARCSPHRGS